MLAEKECLLDKIIITVKIVLNGVSVNHALKKESYLMVVIQRNVENVENKNLRATNITAQTLIINFVIIVNVLLDKVAFIGTAKVARHGVTVIHALCKENVE